MSTATIKSRLRAAFFVGALGVLPAVALADSGSSEAPAGGGTDRATVESRRGSDEVRAQDPAAAKRPTDQAAAQARGNDQPRSGGQTTRAPDHNDVEAR
jgi:hypothetical protein